jgi:hypothetical protein
MFRLVASGLLFHSSYLIDRQYLTLASSRSSSDCQGGARQDAIRGCLQTNGLGVYEAMDWLLQCQPRIEKKLATRHLGEGSLVLYYVRSSYYERPALSRSAVRS